MLTLDQPIKVVNSQGKEVTQEALFRLVYSKDFILLQNNETEFLIKDICDNPYYLGSPVLNKQGINEAILNVYGIREAQLSFNLYKEKLLKCHSILNKL